MVEAVSSSYNSYYEHQLEIILKQELKVEDLQAKLINNGGSYAAMIKNEEQIKVKFAELMKTKYPELSGFTADQIVDMINQIPEILTIPGRIAEAIGEYGSIGALEDDLNAYNNQITFISSGIAEEEEGLAAYQSLLDGIIEQKRLNSVELSNARTELTDVVAALTDDPTNPELLAQKATLETQIANLNTVLADLNDQIASLEGQIAEREEHLAISRTILTQTTATRDDLQERFDLAVSLNAQLQALVAGNVVYSLYASFSDTEKELITLFTN